MLDSTLISRYCADNSACSYANGASAAACVLDFFHKKLSHLNEMTSHTCRSLEGRILYSHSTVLHKLTYTLIFRQAWPHPVSAGADGQAFAVCVCVSKDVVRYILEGFTNWALSRGRKKVREKRRDRQRERESDRHKKKREREGEEPENKCVCVWRGGGLKCPGLNHVWRWQGLRTPCCWGNKTKQQAQMYKL